ncbi:MAG: hypothetical protein LBE38_05240 [Deltaproteobacteria bacterium]|nr:hypothetical protein [Deltaproteobacteria bacterium]
MPSFRLRYALTLASGEWKSFWSSPAGGLSILVFLLLSGLFIYNSVASYALLNLSAMSRGGAMDATLGLFSASLEQLGLIIMLVTPLTTMKAFSPFNAGGHLDLLLSLPITRLELTLGYFISAFLSLLLLTLLALLPYLFLIFLGVGSFGLLLNSILGFILLISAFVAVGLAVSSRALSPLASALATLGLLALFWALGWAAPYLSRQVAYVLMGLAFGPRLTHFSLGLLDLNDVVYFLVLTIVGLYLARSAGR